MNSNNQICKQGKLLSHGRKSSPDKRIVKAHELSRAPSNFKADPSVDRDFKRACSGLLCASLVTLAVGCGTMASRGNGSLLSSFNGSPVNASGSMAVTRNVPAPSAVTSGPVFGFMPSSKGSSINRSGSPLVAGTWVEVAASSGKVSLMKGNELVKQGTLELSKALVAGTYRVVHRQKDPLWHANDDYFLTRKMALPPVGSHDRYLRGALGDVAIYLDGDTAIHNGPIADPGVGGIKVDGELAHLLYNELENGSVVVVR